MFVRLPRETKSRYRDVLPAHPPVIKVAIVEDQRQTREGLTALVATGGYECVGSWRTMEDAIARIEALDPDVLLADIGLPGMSGIDGVRILTGKFPRLQILMLTVYADDDHVFEAICAGACGYLLKDSPPSKLLDAIKDAANGGAPMSSEIARRVVTMFQQFAPPKTTHTLSSRERDVLQRLADGHSYKTAAAALEISLDTLRFHVRNIYAKLHVNSKSDAVLKAFRQGIIR
jgi:DNA-binding NarL/FixJ family response regulator